MTTLAAEDSAGELYPVSDDCNRSVASLRLTAAAIVLLSGLLYLPVMRGSAVWDDNFLIRGTGLSGATKVFQCFSRAFLWNYYRPLTGATFVLDHRIWGANTFGYHLTNLILHMLTTAVMIPLLLVSFRRRRVALWGSALFAVQPIQVSTVAWIGGRTDSLCTFFIALFWLVLVMGARSAGLRRSILLTASFILFAAAAAAKEQALILVPMVPLALYVFRAGNRGKSKLSSSQIKEMALWTAPFVIFGPYLLLTWKKFGDPIHPHWNFAFQFPAVGRTIDYYLLLILTPTPRLLHTWTLGAISKSGAISIVIGYMLAAGAVVAFVRWMRSKPVLAWFFAGTVLLLVPVSNAFPLITQVVAPYRAGTAGFGAAAVIGWAIVDLLDKARASKTVGPQSRWVAAPALIYLVWLGSLTLWDTRIWRTQLDASLAVEHYDPTSTFGTLEVAASYIDKGQTEPAVARLDRIMETVQNHRYTVVRSDSALWWMYGGYPADWIGELYGRAGNLKLDQGDRGAAIILLNKGDLLTPSNEYIRAGLANCAFAVHDVDGGIRELRKLLQYRPRLIDDRIVLAQVLWRTRRWKEADVEIIKCLQRKPSDYNLYLMSAYARVKLDDRTGAKAMLEGGLQNGALNAGALKGWLASIGEPGLMNFTRTTR